MSSIFSRLLDESDKQRRQLQGDRNPASNVSPPLPSSPVFEAPGILPQLDAPTVRQNDGPSVRPTDEATKRPSDVPTVRRTTERTAFDLYKDQIVAIRHLRAERELDGNSKVSLSEIAREAFDLYLKKKGKTSL
jgi:hypothetical protein